MSFDLFATNFHDGAAAPGSAPAILAVLRPFLTVGPEEGGFCRTTTPDGGEADFYVGDEGFMVNHFSPGETGDLIRRAASNNGLVLFAPGLPAMLTDAGQLDHLPDALLSLEPAPVIVSTGAELDALISGDPETYQRCRGRLVGPVRD